MSNIPGNITRPGMMSDIETKELKNSEGNFDLKSPAMETKGTLESEELPDDGETAAWIKKKTLPILLRDKSYGDLRLRSVVSIFRVPNFLKDTKNEKAFVPQIVSLGPYHSNRPQLSPMEYHKRTALRRMMTRFNIKRGATDPDNMEFSFRAIHEIFQEVDNIKNSYEERIDCKPEHLAEMLTLDGCFLLEIFRTLGGDKLIWEGSDKYEPIFDRNRIYFTGFDILNDILKVENQIPLIVLRKLLETESNPVDTADKFLFDVLVKIPGTKFYPFDYDMKEWSWPQPVEQVHHLLGLLHSLIVSPPSDTLIVSTASNDGDGTIPWKERRCISPAVELSNAGIKFQRCNGGIKQIYFDQKKATMYLPPINVTDHTEVLFCNLIALELCQASGDNYLTCYLSLMNNLINTDKDVAVLRKSAIINIYVGNDAEVADLFHGLCKGITLARKCVFLKLENDVMAHYDRKFRVLFAQFKKTYFSAWTIPVILGLLLTLVQTICAILQ